MMMRPKISVILCTYNRPKMLQRMMKCIFDQKFKDFELLLIDNGSKDETPRLCKEYEKQDGRVRLYILPENVGPAGGKNFGLQKAEAEYICFVDDDDYCEPDYLSLFYDLITKYDADIAVSGCADEYDSGDGSGVRIVPKFDYKEIYVFDKIQGVSEFLKREKFNAAPPTKIFRKKLFDGISFIPREKGPDDIHVIYKLFVEAEKIVVCGKPTYRFHKHEDNITSYITKDMITADILDEYLFMQKERVEYISKRIPQLAAQVRYAAYSYMISHVDKICTGRGIGCDKQLEEMKRILYQNREEFLASPWITPRERDLMAKYVL